MSTALINDTNDESFENVVLGSADPMLLDCLATGCGPRMAIAPVLDKASQACSGRLRSRWLE